MRPYLFLLPLFVVVSAAQAAPVSVPVDQARRLVFQGSAASVVVGNKDIADVKTVDSRTLMVLGKKPGVTNVMVLDQAGHTLFDDEVQVAPAPGAVVTVYRAAQAADYTCSPYCQGVEPGGLAGLLAAIGSMADATKAAAPPTAPATATAPAAASAPPPVAPH